MNEIRTFTGFRQARGSTVKRTIEVVVPAGVTVSATGHTVTHTPPAGGTVTAPTLAPASPNVTLTFDAGDAALDVGRHLILVIIALSDGQKWDCQLEVEVYA